MGEQTAQQASLRKAITDAVIQSLTDEAILPKWIQTYVLGLDMRPLVDLIAAKIIPAVETWLAPASLPTQDMQDMQARINTALALHPTVRIPPDWESGETEPLMWCLPCAQLAPCTMTRVLNGGAP